MSEITPALTAEEWAERRAYALEIGYDKNDPANHIGPDDADWDPELDEFRQMAMANDDLPDDDPRKISRADVEAVRVAAHGLHSAAMEYGGLSEREADADSEVLAAYRVAEAARLASPLTRSTFGPQVKLVTTP